MTLSASYCKNYVDKTKNLLAKDFYYTVTSYVAYPMEMGSIKTHPWLNLNGEVIRGHKY